MHPDRATGARLMRRGHRLVPSRPACPTELRLGTPSTGQAETSDELQEQQVDPGWGSYFCVFPSCAGPIGLPRRVTTQPPPASRWVD